MDGRRMRPLQRIWRRSKNLARAGGAGEMTDAIKSPELIASEIVNRFPWTSNVRHKGMLVSQQVAVAEAIAAAIEADRAALAAAQAGDAGEPSVYETPDLHGRAGAIRKDGLAEGSPADPFIRGVFHDESIRRSGFAAGIEAALAEFRATIPNTMKQYPMMVDRIRALRPPAE